MIEKKPVSVLISPLDWGLGHTTRCIPIIHELIRQGVRVVVAVNQTQKILLIMEFPSIEFLEIPGYNIRYKQGFMLKWGLFYQIPMVLKSIKRENEWLKEYLSDHEIDAVISDNRYGLYHHQCLCIFITHQLQIQSGFWAHYKSLSSNVFRRWIDRKLLLWNYQFIEKFSRCWVPDMEGGLSFGGRLSHPSRPPAIPVKYIGNLSRFHSSGAPVQKNTLLIILSGPEPQRTEFEKIIFNQLANTEKDIVLLRGLPDSGLPVPAFREKIKIWNHLPSDELNELINRSEYIIARSGYSTVMDLLAVNKTAILVPTPGQTEQEYLGNYLHEKKWMYLVAQKDFNLKSALKAFDESKLELPDLPSPKIQGVIAEFIREISLGDNRPIARKTHR